MKKKNILLVCHADKSTGLGHLSRLLALAQSLRKINKLQLELLIFGEELKNKELDIFKVQWIPINNNLENTIKKNIKNNSFSLIVFDLYPKLLPDKFEKLLIWIKEKKIKIIGIDSLRNYINFLDFMWIPSFSLNMQNKYLESGKLKFGWDSLLIQKRQSKKAWKGGHRVLVLTGGSDNTELRNSLPAKLDSTLNSNYIVDWVQGPFSELPNIPSQPRLTWHVHKNITHLDDLIVKSGYALTVFGISFFEVLQYGIPTVVFSPYGNKDTDELEALSKEGVAMVAMKPSIAVRQLVEVMNNDLLAMEYSKKALKKLSVNGAQSLSEKIYSLVKSQ